jgi:DNA-binding transcriptional regulator YbjK
MKVTATKAGFHGGRYREVGAEFDVPDGAKASWFKQTQQLEADVKADAAKALAAKAEAAKADADNAVKAAAEADAVAKKAGGFIQNLFKPGAPKEGGDLV